MPAATLLLPYFEVDLANADGVKTLFTINNAAPEPALAHIIFWTDWSAPTLDFDVFLTGYDVVVVDLDQVFQGYIPITADEQSDPDDLTSPHGDPLWDGSFTSCDLFFPFYVNPALVGSTLARLVDGHTGQPVPGGDCLGADHGDNVARGFITVDSVGECNLTLFPSDPGYFVSGGEGIANNKNLLWGEMILAQPAAEVDGTPNVLVSAPLVHIEAADDMNDLPANGYTFYNRYVDGSTADEREPLGTAWGTRYFNGADLYGMTQSSNFIAWRDTTDATVSDIACGVGPPWLPLDETQILCFDESETSVEVCSEDDGSYCLPLATQNVPVTDLGIPYTSGWCYFNLNHDCETCDPGAVGAAQLAQSYVAVSHTVNGNWLGGLSMVELASACEDVNDSVEVAFFRDGFESGDLALWSLVENP